MTAKADPETLDRVHDAEGGRGSCRRQAVRTGYTKALLAIRRPFIRRWLARVDERPVLAVAGLRSVFWMTPALTYALAFTRVGFRDYMIGTALGLALPVAAMSVFFDWLLS